MVEVITIDDYKQVIKNTEINNISDESIQTAINITTLTLDSVCGSNISKRWPLDETNRLHLTIEQKEYIRNAFILQTKYVLDNNIDFSVGTDQSTNGSSSWSQTRLKREQILPEVYELLQTAGVYYTNAFISTAYSNANEGRQCKCTCPDDFYCPGEKSTPIDLEIGDNRYIKQYNPNARRKWLFSDERGLITYTSTNPERWVLDCIINGESVVEPFTNIARFEMIKDILDENGTSLIDPDTHIATLNEWLKVDLSNNTHNFTNGVSILNYNGGQWVERHKIEGETLGAPIKIGYFGYASVYQYNDKYHCLTIQPDLNNVIQFNFLGEGMWNTISATAASSINITDNNDDTNLIIKTFGSSGDKNTLTFNIAPNQIFERNKTLLDQYISDNFVQVFNGGSQEYTHYVSTTSLNYNLDHTMNTDGYYSIAFNFVNNVSTKWEQWYQWYQVKFSVDGGNTFTIYEYDSIERPANDRVISEKGWNYQRCLTAGPFKKGTIVRFICDNNSIRIYPANDGQNSGYNAVIIEKPITLIKKG